MAEQHYAADLLPLVTWKSIKYEISLFLQNHQIKFIQKFLFLPAHLYVSLFLVMVADET